MDRIEGFKPAPRRKDIFKGCVSDYAAEGPLFSWSESHLNQCIAAAVRPQARNLEVITLAIRELKNQGFSDLAAKEALAKSGLTEIPWLEGLRYRMQTLRNEFNFDPKGNRSCKVYFILLTEADQDLTIRGLYVGQTFRKIETRFQQHKNPDCKARSGIVLRRGHQLLYSVSSLLPSMTRSNS